VNFPLRLSWLSRAKLKYQSAAAFQCLKRFFGYLLFWLFFILHCSPNKRSIRRRFLYWPVTAPPELAQSVAEGLREAGEIANVTKLKTIADEFKSQLTSAAPMAEKIVRLAEEFDFNAITRIADDLVEE